MSYLFETELLKDKPIFLSLTKIYGLKYYISFKICKRLGFSKNSKIKNLSKEQINKINKVIESLNLKLASDLKKLNVLSIKKLIFIKSYKGLRKIRGLPVRGQRTHTNAKTAQKHFNYSKL